ncbi:MAG: hypothetical protein JRH15_21415, partial [Deltaproteobacteria bacterium]|nr:hypothetical protein [Deltaproteobacteria bacterium]
MSRKILGLDIRPKGIWAVLVQTGFKANAIVDYAQVSYAKSEPGADPIAAALADIAGRMDLSGAVCAACVPAMEFAYRNMTTPFGEPKKIRQMLPYEMESALAVPVDNLIIDFTKTTVPGENGGTRLIAAAGESAKLKAHIDALETHAITPNIITPGAYPVALFLNSRTDTPDNWLLVDMDDRAGTLILAKDRHICLIRAFPLSQSPDRVPEQVL